MKWIIYSIIFLALANTARGGELWDALFAHARCWPHCVGPATCDDYCGKPPPCMNVDACFQCPDYCPKCPPIVCEQGVFTCDDYCRKPFPRLNCPHLGK